MTEIRQIAVRHKNSTPCMECASKNTAARTEIDEFEYLHGDDIVQLRTNVEVHTCQDCGFQFTDSTAEEARHDAVCEFLGVLTPAEVKAVRNQYDMSRSQMAAVSKIGEASLARWESAALIQSGAYDNYLFLLRFAENLMRIQKRASGEIFAAQITHQRNWRSLTVTEKIRHEQSSFSLSLVAA